LALARTAGAAVNGFVIRLGIGKKLAVGLAGGFLRGKRHGFHGSLMVSTTNRLIPQKG
jgi:hypothetical protein